MSIFRRGRKSESSQLEAEEETKTAQKEDDRLSSKPIKSSKSSKGWRRGISVLWIF